ncbi:serine carboxypeptidase 24-like isoform X2 [Quercus robur]|uniref:serine carboxypeptidase 24-like isoform X2 n=1 Tax=Quercus robur TaxID=38942 RepID=UPI0021634998|nr:serine carboxypeptidase 24-like isoform X2 [Quercus robur]
MVFQSVVLKLFMSLLFFSSTITTAIATLPKQQELDRISALPGQPPVTFSQFSGYVTVNEQHGRALFYWLTEATSFPEKKPLVLWLNGGPGASSVAFGASEEIGPFRINSTGSSLYLNEYSWNRGHYIPQLAEKIVEYNKALLQPAFNFKGFIVGNPVFDNYYDKIGVITYYWTHSMISDRIYHDILNECNFKEVNQSSVCNGRQIYAEKYELGFVDQYSIYTTPCVTLINDTWAPPRLRNTLLHPRVSGYDPCTRNYAEKYYNLPEVQKAMHANVTGILHNWIAHSADIQNNWTDSEFSMLPTYKKLFAADLRIWVFSGDTDSVVPVISTRLALNHLNLTVKTKWYPWYADDQVGGWTEVYDQLTFATVRGAGHEVPLFQPKRAFILFKSFLAGKELPHS